MGNVKAGGIYYDIEIDTSKLLEARREINSTLDGLSSDMNRLNASMTRTERTVSQMGSSLSSMTGIAKSLMAALSAGQVSAWANEWVTVNNKLVNSTRATEQLSEVTQRVFNVSQNTMSSLSATSTLYARLERATRSAGTSTDDLIKLTSTINKGLAVSGATTEEASSTMIQLSQALASGVLRGEEFNSISENGSRLAQALADSLGVTIGQLRGMAAQGKLTTDIVVNGLLGQSDKIAREFANTTATLSQSLEVAGNNLIKFFGENTTVRTFISSAGSGVVTLSNHIETLASVLSVAAVVMGGRYVGALTMAAAAQGSRIKATIQGIAATRQQAQQEAAAAAVLVRKTQADTDAALSALNYAKAEYVVARGSAAEAFALENVIRLKAAYVAISAEGALANNALATSQARLAATGVTLANAMKVLNFVTSPLGGPVGAIAAVAAGWYLYAQRQAEARKEAVAFADTLPDVVKRLKELNLAQAEGVRADTETSIKAQKQAIDGLKESIASSQADYEKYTALAKQYGVTEDENNGYVINAKEAANDLAKKRRDLDGATATLQQSEDALHLINIQVNQGIVDQMKAARDAAAALSEAENKSSFLGSTQSFLAEKLGISTAAIQKFNAESLKINWGGSAGEKLIKQAERKLALAKLQGEARERLQAQYDAEDAGTKDPLAVKRLQDMYAATFKATKATADQSKENKASASTAKTLAGQQDSVVQKLDALRQRADLTAISTDNLSLEQAKLQARLSLGKNATAAQIAESDRYTTSIWQQAAAIKARNLVPESKENDDYQNKQQQLDILKGQTDSNGKLLISQQQYQEQSEKLAQEHQVNLAKIAANKAANITPLQQARGEIDPVQRLANEHQQQLKLIQQFETQKGVLTQNGLMLLDAENTAYEKKRADAMWALYTQQSTGYQALGAAVDGFGQSASSSLTGVITGSENLASALQNIGNTVLNSVVQTFVEMGLQSVKSAIMGEAANNSALLSIQATQSASMAKASVESSVMAAKSTAEWTPAATMASIGSWGGAVAIGVGAIAGILALSGKRKNGGPVSGGAMYQVGEGGKPEIFKASNGSQYMIPGDNGRVISNREMNSGQGSSSGGVNQTIHFNIQTTGGIDDSTMAKMSQMMRQVARATISDEQRPNGLLQKSR